MDVVIKATEKQKEAHKALEENTIVLYGGAIRGAKSYWGCMELVTMCFKYPRSRWIALRQSSPTLKSTLLVTFRENFLDKGFDSYVESFNQSSMVLTWNNGSQIIFMAESYDTDKELNRFRGLEINGGLIDEANEIQEVTFNKVIERSGSWFGAGKVPIKIWMTTNPTKNWIKKRIYDKWRDGCLPKSIAYIPAKITDNPHVPQEYIESLKTLPRYEYEVFVNGNWDLSIKTGGEAYKSFELDKHVGLCEYKPNLPIHVSFDENVNPYLPCGIFQIEGKHIMMIDEIVGVTPNNKLSWIGSEIKRKYNGHASGVFVYGDATSQKDDVKLEQGYNFFRLIMDDLRVFKPVLRVMKSNPSVAMRLNWINTWMENGHGGIFLTIDDKCKTAIDDFILTKEAADGTKNKEMVTDPDTKVRYQKHGHFSDLFDYFVTTAFAREYQDYQLGDVQKSISGGRRRISKNSY